MEYSGGSERRGTVAIYEFLLTMSFMWGIMMVAGTAYANFVPAILFMMLILGGNVSGGHYNPAVTLGVFINEKKFGQDASLAGIMMVSQFAGAVAGAFFGWLSEGVFTPDHNSDYGNIPSGWIPYLYPVDGLTVATKDHSFQTFFTQTVLTFVFVLTILCVKSKEAEPSGIPAIGAMTVSAALQACIFAGSREGSCFNPAIALGQILVVLTQSQDEKDFNAYWWCYIFAPFVGGGLAGLVSLVHRKVIAKGGNMDQFKGQPIE